MAKLQDGPPVVRFYQLAAMPLEDASRRIAEKAWQRGLRVCLVTGGGSWETFLDDYLWQVPAHGFLPHGRCLDPQPQRQPVLLCPEPEDLNGASVVLITNGFFLDTPDRFDMIIDFVPADQPERLQASRERYKRYRELGSVMEYWVQSTEGWQKRSG